MKICKIAGHSALALAASLLTAGAGVAAPYAITHTGTMLTSTVPGVIGGQTYEATLVFDNGGATAASQTWNGSHLKCTIWKFNTARNVVFTQHHSGPVSTANGSVSTNPASALQTNFTEVENTSNASYAIVGTAMSGPVSWYMNNDNGIFYRGADEIGDDTGGVQMAPAGWSNPAPFNGDCDGVYLGTPPAPAAVPTLSEWAMILLGTMLAGFASLTLMRRRQIG